MGTTRTARLRSAGIIAASALTLATGLAACSSSDGGGTDNAASDGSGASGSASPGQGEGDANGLAALLPGAQAFGPGFAVSRIPAEDFANTMSKADAASAKQTSDPPQCKSVLDTAGDIDPHDSAMEAAANKEKRTTMAVIVTHADTTLDTARAHLDECTSFTVSAQDATEKVDVQRFAPAGADGDQAIGLTRTETIADTVRTTTIAANAVDGIAIQVIAQKGSTKALPDGDVEQFQEKTSQILQNVSDKVTQD